VLAVQPGSPVLSVGIKAVAVGKDGRVWVAFEGPAAPDYDRDVFLTFSDYYRGARTLNLTAERAGVYGVRLSWEVRRSSQNDRWTLWGEEARRPPAPGASERRLSSRTQAVELASFSGLEGMLTGEYADSTAPQLRWRMYWLVHTHPGAISDTLGPVVVDFSEFTAPPTGRLILHPVPFGQGDRASLLVRVPSQPGLTSVVVIAVGGQRIATLWERGRSPSPTLRFLDLSWDGRLTSGELAPNGVYFVAARNGDGSHRRGKCILLRD
jgi:hypothetical protein